MSDVHLLIPYFKVQHNGVNNLEMNNKYFYPQSVEFIFRMCLRTNGEYFFIQQLTGQPNENVESALFWDIAQLGVAIPDQRFGTTFKGQEIQDLLTLEDGADKQSSRIKKNPRFIDPRRWDW